MKRYAWIIVLTAGVVVVFASLVLPRTVLGFEPQLNVNGPQNLGPFDVTGMAANHGVVFGTAAINADGTIGGCFNCVASHTFRLGGNGNYQVGFNQGNIQAIHGWARQIQVDTLQASSIHNVSCSTADRSGDVTAIFVVCYNGSGINTNTSFFLTLTR